jgi:hypothetical protein
MLGLQPLPAAGAAVFRSARSIATAFAVMALLVGSIVGPTVDHVRAADGPQLDARVLLEGHARLGSWLAIDVRLRNEGAPIVGELRLQGGSQGGTRFSMPVDLPSPSDKHFTLHAQPPSFGQQLEVLLVVGNATVAEQKVSFTVHDQSQLTVGVIASQIQGIVGGIQLPANQNGIAPVVIPLDPTDLPDRIEAWSALDRLIWQDVDSNTLTKAQIAALRGWLALGGRLIIIGGTAGPGVLSGFPDDILPYRPTTTIDVAPESMTALLGQLPKSATDVPALAGDLTRGRPLITSGDRVVAAEAAYGSGAVTVIGIDPTVGWIADSKATTALWRGLIPARAAGSISVADDSQIVGAVSQLPSLALPPIGGLLGLLLAYILLIGPINYIVLRRLDRREWAWITMPVLIAVFAVGAYVFGSALRGSDVIVNEVAIVRGAPDATEGSAQVYLGVFSPTRGTYQLAVKGGALLSAPVVGDFFGGQGTLLDVVQGETARVRDLSVGFGSLRTVRAESAAPVPKVHADLSLVNGVLKGTLRNDSTSTLESPAIVLGTTAVVLADLKPGDQATVNLAMNTNAQFRQALSDEIFGQIFFDGSVGTTDKQRRTAARHQIVDQLTFDPQSGNMGPLPSDEPVLLAWTRDSVLDVEIEGQKPSRAANVLYYIPVPMKVSGTTTFQADLIRSTVLASDAAFFNKDPFSMNFGQGSVTMAYRPVPFDGTFAVTKVLLSMGFGDQPIGGAGKPIKPIPAPTPAPTATDCLEPCESDQPFPNGFDGVPELDVFNRTTGEWSRLPHLAQGTVYDLADPTTYVDPASGTIQIRFVNDNQDGVGFLFSVVLEGDVR